MAFFFKEVGYKITILGGYNFSRQSDVLNSYIETIYKIKANARDGVEKSTAKSLLKQFMNRY